MLWHLVIHEGVILVANNASGVGDLGDIARAITFVGAATVPNLIVESGSEVLLSAPSSPIRFKY